MTLSTRPPKTSAAPTAHEILARLLELTPLPSAELEAELEIDELLAQFDAMLGERAAVMALIVPPLPLDDAARQLRDELERRDAAWQASLARALRIVGEQRCGVSRLRAYAPLP